MKHNIIVFKKEIAWKRPYILPYYIYAAIGRHLTFESDCIVNSNTSQFSVKVIQGDAMPAISPHYLDYKFTHVCYDSLGRMVWPCRYSILISLLPVCKLKHCGKGIMENGKASVRTHSMSWGKFSYHPVGWFNLSVACRDANNYWLVAIICYS